MASAQDPYVIVDAAGRRCAFPVAAVRETMRPLPLQAVAHAPEFVLGVSVIRGGAVPVVNLGVLLGGVPGPHARFVTLRAGERTVAIAVSAVLGLRSLEAGTIGEMPPLLAAAGGGAADAIALHDGELLNVLNAARLIPDEVWSILNRGGASDGS